MISICNVWIKATQLSKINNTNCRTSLLFYLHGFCMEIYAFCQHSSTASGTHLPHGNWTIFAHYPPSHYMAICLPFGIKLCVGPPCHLADWLTYLLLYCTWDILQVKNSEDTPLLYTDSMSQTEAYSICQMHARCSSRSPLRHLFSYRIPEVFNKLLVQNVFHLDPKPHYEHASMLSSGNTVHMIL